MKHAYCKRYSRAAVLLGRARRSHKRFDAFTERVSAYRAESAPALELVAEWNVNERMMRWNDAREAARS